MADSSSYLERRAVGPDFPVLCKMNANDFIRNGLTPAERFPAAHRLAELGADALELSGGIFETLLHTCRGSMPVDLIALDRSAIVRQCLLTVFRLQKMFIPFEEAYSLLCRET